MPGSTRCLTSRSLSYLAAAFCAALAFAHSSYAQDARSLYKEGLRAFRAGNQAGAIRLFTQSADADPTYVYPYLALGRIYQEFFEQESRNYEDAVVCYERLSSLLRAKPPRETETALYQGIYFQGLLYLKGGEFEKAIASLREFLELSPDFSSPENVRNAIGIGLYYVDQYDLAVAEFRKAIDLKPDFAEARFNLRSVFVRLASYNQAVANARAGNMETALHQVTELMEHAPRYLPARRLAAELYLKTGQEERALAAMSEILALEPDHPITYGVRLEMAKLLDVRGETARALDLLRENLRRFPESPDKEAREQVMKLLGRFGGAP